MEDRNISAKPLSELLLTTKDGDWGEEAPHDGYIPYRVIRGADFPAVRLGDISTTPLRYLEPEASKRRTLMAGDIIIETAGGNRDRPTGRTLLVSDRLLQSFGFPVTCASFCRFLRIDPAKAYSPYVFWYLQYMYARGEMWEHQVQHTGVARFQYTKFAATTSIPLPPLEQQQAIALVLDKLDEKIELNRQMNETLEAIEQALFKSWFIDASANGLPEGWRESTIGDEVRVVGGSTPSTKEPEFWDCGTIHWATPKDLSDLDSPVLLDTERRITDAGLTQISSGLLPSGTVLLSSRAPIGYLAISEVPVAVNQGFIAMVCDNQLPNYYVRLWAGANMDLIKANANGTTFLEISKSNFRPLQVVVPLKPVLDEFVHQVQPLHQRVVANLRESITLASLRDSLLPKLLSGAIRIETTH